MMADRLESGYVETASGTTSIHSVRGAKSRIATAQYQHIVGSRNVQRLSDSDGCRDLQARTLPPRMLPPVATPPALPDVHTLNSADGGCRDFPTPRGASRREIPEGHAESQLRPGPWILPTHDGMHIIPGSVQTRDRLAGAVQHLGMNVRPQAQARPKRCGEHRDRTVGRRFDRPETGVRRMLGITVPAVVRVAPLAEVGIDARPGKLVVGPNRREQSRRVDADLARQAFHRVRDVQVAAVDEPLQHRRERSDHPKTVLPDETPIADEDGGNARDLPVRAIHRSRELVLRDGFADKAPSRRVAGNEPRLT